MKPSQILTALAAALALSSCAAFDAAEYESGTFPAASAVVGQRTVVGLEWPLSKFGVGIGVWTVRRSTAEVTESEFPLDEK